MVKESTGDIQWLVLTYDLSFKVICDFECQTDRKHARSSLWLHVELWVVIFAHRKSYAGNPMVVLDLPYDLSIKVIYDFEGRTYTIHAISPLLLQIEMQYVPAYSESWSMNPLVTLVLTYDLRLWKYSEKTEKNIIFFEKSQATNHDDLGC